MDSDVFMWERILEPLSHRNFASRLRPDCLHIRKLITFGISIELVCAEDGQLMYSEEHKLELTMGSGARFLYGWAPPINFQLIYAPDGTKACTLSIMAESARTWNAPRENPDKIVEDRSMHEQWTPWRTEQKDTVSIFIIIRDPAIRPNNSSFEIPLWRRVRKRFKDWILDFTMR